MNEDNDPNINQGDSGRPTIWDFERRVSGIERRVALLEQSTKTIKEELSKINNNLTKLVFVVITAVVLAGLNVIFNGTGGVQ